MKLLNTAVFLAFMLPLSTAYAHEQDAKYNQINLEATASAEVENDTMIASLFAQEEGTNVTALSNKVNRAVNWALEKLKRHKSIKVETQSYSTYPVYNKSQIIAWRVKQLIQLESQDMSLMSEVVGELQQQLKLNDISFDVSADRQQEASRALIDQALTAFDDRATQIAHKLKSDQYKIVNMNISTTENPGLYKHRMVSAMRAEAAPMVAPEVARGDQTITVRVNGTIELQK